MPRRTKTQPPKNDASSNENDEALPPDPLQEVSSDQSNLLFSNADSAPLTIENTVLLAAVSATTAAAAALVAVATQLQALVSSSSTSQAAQPLPGFDANSTFFTSPASRTTANSNRRSVEITTTIAAQQKLSRGEIKLSGETRTEIDFTDWPEDWNPSVPDNITVITALFIARGQAGIKGKFSATYKKRDGSSTTVSEDFTIKNNGQASTTLFCHL